MKRFLLLFTFCGFISFCVGHHTFAATVSSGELVKASQPTVYYSLNGKRYAFSNEQVYRSWYDDFSTVKTISDEALAALALALAGNITYRPGKSLVKVTTNPKVFAIERGHSLRWVPDEIMAKAIYGSNWAKQVRDISDAEFQDYEVNYALTSADDFHASYISDLFVRPSSVLFDEGWAGKAEDLFPLPQGSRVHLENPNGYMSSTTKSADELISWFKGQGDGEKLLYEKTESLVYEKKGSLAIGTSTFDMTMVNFGLSVSDTFRHRSLVISPHADKAVLWFYYHDITFPKGFLVYPRSAMEGTEHYQMFDSFEYTAGTFDSKELVLKWYRENAPSYGWKEIEPLASDESEGEEAIKFVTTDRTKQLVLSFVHANDSLTGLSVEMKPYQASEATSTPNTTAGSSLSATEAAVFAVPPNVTIFGKTSYGYNATTTMSATGTIEWFTSVMKGGSMLYQENPKEIFPTDLNYGLPMGDSFMHRGLRIIDLKSYRQIVYRETLFPKSAIMYPRANGGAQVTHPYFGYLAVTQDRAETIKKWYEDNVQKNGWHIVRPLTAQDIDLTKEPYNGYIKSFAGGYLLENADSSKFTKVIWSDEKPRASIYSIMDVQCTPSEKIFGESACQTFRSLY